ncbi:unnamed protein product [Prorocentrum cordatum]|uniref:Ankyrin repeat domain-containing protein n=1 Tax=Prorocentrum cordatum TaxID=2364126 RepID=A0ABN9T7Y6_9DINO|nr:unnamed protein product [Polarella glacialis]
MRRRRRPPRPAALALLGAAPLLALLPPLSAPGVSDGTLATAAGAARWGLTARPRRRRAAVLRRFFFEALESAEAQLARAARAGDAQRVQELLSQGARIDEPSGQSKATPLIGAAANGHAAVVELLLDAGADAEVGLESDGPLRPGGATALFIAAQQGHAQVVELLLRRGAVADAARGDGLTPLDIAKKKGNEAVVGLLEGRAAPER